MTPLIYMKIERKAAQMPRGNSKDMIKDAIVEVFADELHLNDVEIDFLYQDFLAYRDENPLIAAVSTNFNRIFP